MCFLPITVPHETNKVNQQRHGKRVPSRRHSLQPTLILLAIRKNDRKRASLHDPVRENRHCHLLEHKILERIPIPSHRFLIHQHVHQNSLLSIVLRQMLIVGEPHRRMLADSRPFLDRLRLPRSLIHRFSLVIIAVKHNRWLPRGEIVLLLDLHETEKLGKPYR